MSLRIAMDSQCRWPAVIRTRAITTYGTLLALIAGIWVTFTLIPSSEELGILQSHEPFGASHPILSNTQSPEDWEFDHTRDGNNYGLSEQQCIEAFPDLFQEIDRAVNHRKDVTGLIHLDEVDVAWRGDGIVRALIHGNQLYILDPRAVWDRNHRPRTIATLHSIHRALTASQVALPDIEFSFTVQDTALQDTSTNHTTWTYTRRLEQETLWLMPDFGLWAWPDVGLRSFTEFLAMLKSEEHDFLKKIPKIVWRGSVAVGSRDVRHGLINNSQNHPWADVQTLDWGNKTNIDENLLSMVDHCAFMFVAQTEGNTYSGRLKYLLNCHSVVISHELTWVEMYHHLLKSSGPDQNYVKVQRDFGDLPDKMINLINPKSWVEAQVIADNARRIFRERYLTPAAEACYWRSLIRGWASVQGFRPKFWKEVEEYDKVTRSMKTKLKPRGAPFESYAIMEATEWDLPAKPRKICTYE